MRPTRHFNHVAQTFLATSLLALGLSGAARAQALPGKGVSVQPLKSSLAEEAFQTLVVSRALEKLGYDVQPMKDLEPATEHLAIANGDASEVQLLGGAQVVREAAGTEGATEFRGEFLHFFRITERVRSHLPVTVRRGTSEFSADAVEYDHLTRVIDLKGRVRAVFASPGTNPSPARR